MLYTKYVENRDAMRALNHSFAYSYGLFKKDFRLKLPHFIISYFPHFVTEFNKIFAALLKLVLFLWT